MLGLKETMEMKINDIIKTYDDLHPGVSLDHLLKSYKYQPELTKKLDELGNRELDLETIYEIVLWKVGRFPKLTKEIIKAINSLSAISFEDLKKSRPTIELLLKTKGIQLPMASTILRFRNPSVFQIIDDRVYRIVCGGETKYPSKPPYKVTDNYINTSIKIYFMYLKKLKALADRCGFNFCTLDRALYQLDINLGNKIGQP